MKSDLICLRMSTTLTKLMPDLLRKQYNNKRDTMSVGGVKYSHAKLRAPCMATINSTWLFFVETLKYISLRNFLNVKFDVQGRLNLKYGRWPICT
jgi:hypothetical protein